MFIAFFHHFSVTSLETSLFMFIYYVFHISFKTESYKKSLFEQAQIYLLYCLEIVTNKLTKKEHMDKD